MIHTFAIGATLIAYTEICAASRSSRRQREVEAVGRIIRQIAGPDCTLTHSADGAPLLVDWHVSVSHSRKLAVVALDREHSVGVDAEEWRPTLRRVAPRFLSDIELKVFDTDEQLLKAWTAKEAVYKIAGAAAVDFRESILLAPDQTTACAADRTFSLHYSHVDDTLITLAKIMDK